MIHPKSLANNMVLSLEWFSIEESNLLQQNRVHLNLKYCLKENENGFKPVLKFFLGIGYTIQLSWNDTKIKSSKRIVKRQDILKAMPLPRPKIIITSIYLLFCDCMCKWSLRNNRSHPHRALWKSVFSPVLQSDCGRRVSVNYGSPSPFDGKADENTSRHASRSLRISVTQINTTIKLHCW